TARGLADGSLLRLESVQNAIEQGKSAAFALLGQDRPFISAPWFWSEQHDVKLQIAGLSTGFDDVVVRGNLADRKFSAFYYRAGHLVAVDSINRPADHVAARRLLDKRLSPAKSEVADESIPLASLIR